MGTRRDNFKSKVRDLIERLYPRKEISKFPDEIDYDKVFKNHAVLMGAYGAVLKKDSKILDKFYRSAFVESHIYKKLKSLRKIYLVEIAALYDTDNNAIRSTLNKLVEDIDNFSSCLFYFPTIGWREFLLFILPSIAAATTVGYHILGFFSELWSQGMNGRAYPMLLSAFGLTFLIYLGFVLGFVAFSFIDKRLLFIFPEYKPQKRFDTCKRWWKAFLGKDIEGTIYEKENKLFKSLKMGKEREFPVDILLFVVIILFILDILATLSILTPTLFAYSFCLLIVPIMCFFMLIRKAF